MTQGVSRILALAGRREAALDLMEFRRTSGLIDVYDALRFDPARKSLVGDQRFESAVANAEARFDSMAAVLEFANERGEVAPYVWTALVRLRAQLAAMPGG